jgi:acetyl esterase
MSDPIRAEQLRDADFRSLSIEQMLERIRLFGEPVDTREDIGTISLKRRFPHLMNVQATDISIPGPAGPLPARIYVDAAAVPTGRGMVWAHGGAFLGGNLDMPEANWVSLELASSGVPVISIDYTKCIGGVHYPAPSNDVLAAWEFVREHSDELLGIDPTGLFIGGASAGATLAASAVQRLSDGGRPVPAGLVLVYPALHPDSVRASASLDETPDSLRGISMNYAGSVHALTDPQVFPGVGTASGFPSTLIVACEFDGFVASAIEFHRTLERAGVSAALRIEEGADHGHINEPSDSAAHRTIDAMREWICEPRIH